MRCTVCNQEIRGITVTKIASETLCGDCACDLDNKANAEMAFEEILEVINRLRSGG